MQTLMIKKDWGGDFFPKIYSDHGTTQSARADQKVE
jgi:hypothetical protein